MDSEVRRGAGANPESHGLVPAELDLAPSSLASVPSVVSPTGEGAEDVG